MAVTPAEIAVALGVAAPDAGSATEKQWQLWIDDAVMLIDARRVKLGKPMPDEAKLDYVVREAVVAQVKKPDDATQVSIQVDDGMTSKSYRSGRGRVTILDEWWILLGLVISDQGAFSVDMIPRDLTVHVPWCSLAFGAVYCSCGSEIAGHPIYEVDDAGE